MRIGTGFALRYNGEEANRRSVSQMSAIQVYSEIGPLKQVLLKRYSLS